MKNKRLVYVSFTFPHHKGTHAGYQHIGEHIHYDIVVDCESFFSRCMKKRISLWSRALARCIRYLFGYPVFPLHIIKCIYLGIRYNDLIFHFIHPENTYVNFKCYIRKGNKIVLTIHQPYEWYDNRLWLNRLRSANLIISLSDRELPKFQLQIGLNNIKYIPHGIDVSFYKPTTLQKDPIVLTVGNWLRDYEFADKVYQKLKELNEKVRIVVVSLPNNKKYISQMSRIDFVSGITDEELKLLYQRCSVLFLPLKRFTANNALLESASCGCNILISANAMDNGYLPENQICITDFDLDKVVDRIQTYLVCPSVNLKLSSYIAENYSWEKIAQETQSLFASLN